MASSEVNNANVNCNDFTKCPICFEDFKLPKCLPCSHSFCHMCLKNHIESSCQSKKAPVGFSCPICRKFIPAENISAKLSDWASGFPSNDILRKISRGSQGNVCDGCQRDGEEEEAKQFCLSCKEKLCSMCAKYHRRLLLTKDHEVLSLDKLKKSPIVTAIEKSCIVHAEKNIKYYCQDHQVPCCTACVCTVHRKCYNIETAMKTAERLRKTEHSKLFVGMNDLEKELTDIKNELEKNVSDIERTSDSLFANVEELYKKILQHFEKNKNEYINQLSKKTKECKRELEENAKSLDEKIAYLKRCKDSINDLKEETKDAQYVRKFHETSNKYTMLKEFYSKSKTGLKLVSLRSCSSSWNIERTNVLGDVSVVTIKEYCSKEKSMDACSKEKLGRNVRKSYFNKPSGFNSYR